MMSQIIALSEAKAKFSELIDRVNEGEEFLITRHERAIARLVPASGHSQAEVRQAVDKIKSLRRGSNISLKELLACRNEGRP